ncbi:MAG: DNA polymerase IV [Actinomycetia bacterium]|nr:DNA polymerase IV [Actinomycetes bacterium]
MGRSADVPRVSGRTDGDDHGCHILHVDMDAFFASVEVRRHPELAGKPVIVGGMTRGVVAAASYEARRYGVHSAMPMGQALRLCPTAVVVHPHRTAYSEASRQVMAIFADVTPLVEPISLDEAFLDVAGARRVLGRPAVIATTIRERVAAELGLTCSVGVAGTKFVAKLASARCKPDGLLVVPVARTLEFLHPLPVTVVWGVGARTGDALHRLGVRTVGDLARTPRETLRRAVGPALAEHLTALAAGRDPRQVHPDVIEKSVSADRTMAVDLTEAGQVRQELLRLSDEVATRVRAHGWSAHTVGIKIRFADFRTVTRVRTLPGWVDSTAAIYATAAELYAELGLDRPRIRLVGVRCENLRPAGSAPEQLSLDWLSRADAADSEGADIGHARALDRATDAVRARFGATGVRPATLLDPGGRRNRSADTIASGHRSQAGTAPGTGTDRRPTPGENGESDASRPPRP